MTEHRRPSRHPIGWFERFETELDPQERYRIAHDTAHALLARIRDDADPAVVERLLEVASADGIDTVAELWATSAAHSLPGALWRIHALHALVVQRAVDVARWYEDGAHRIGTIDPVIAGAPAAASPDEMRAVSEQILRGAFTGDFALALDRAAAFARVVAAGCLVEADANDEPTPGSETVRQLTARATRLIDMARDLSASAALWRRDALD